MTAIITARRADGVIMLSDAANYDHEGVVGDIAPKAILMPQAPAVLAFRGRREFQRGMLSISMEALTFDDLLLILPTSAKVAADFAFSGVGAGGKAEMVVAGWSAQRCCAEVYLLYTYEAEYRSPTGKTETAGPFKLILQDNPYLGAKPADDLWSEFGLAALPDVERFDPMSHGIAWMQALRRDKQWLGFHGVGGYVQMTRVGPPGLDSQIIHKWPADKVGSKIVPA